MKFDIDVVRTHAKGSTQELAKLASDLMYPVPGAEYTKSYRRGVWSGMKSLMGVDQRFPSGLAFDERFDDADRFQMYDPVKPQGDGVMDLRVYQSQAIDTFMPSHRGVICMPPGTGKTIVALEVIARVGWPAIWLTHRIELAQQVAKLSKQYGFTPSLWGGGIHEEASDLTIATLQTAHSRGLPKDAPDYQVVVFDECHHCARDNTYLKVMSKIHATWRIGLTATPPHETLEDAYLRGSTGRVFSVDPRYLQQKGFLCIPDLLTLRGVEYPDVPYAELLTLIAKDKRRAAGLWYQLSNWDQVVIFVSRIAHGQLLESVGRRLGITVEFVSGKTAYGARMDALDRLSCGKLPYLVTTLFDEGIDLPELEVVCLAEPFTSSRLLVQRCGRVMRPMPDKHPEVLDVLDMNSRCLEMFRKRLQVYRDLGVYAS